MRGLVKVLALSLLRGAPMSRTHVRREQSVQRLQASTESRHHRLSQSLASCAEGVQRLTELTPKSQSLETNHVALSALPETTQCVHRGRPQMYIKELGVTGFWACCNINFGVL